MGIHLPPGLNFCPTDQELIKLYLRYKLVGKSLLPPEFNSYMPHKILYGQNAQEPSQLFAGRSEEYLYFFTQVNKKFVNGNGNHMERIAGNGTWTIQKTYDVLDDDNKTLIGYRKNFTFDPKNKHKAEEHNKPEKISYIMNEFTPLKYPPSFQNHHQAAAEWSVCKIRKMVTKNKNYRPPPSSSSSSSAVSSSMPKIKQADHPRKRARTSSHELMLQQSTTPPSTMPVMPSYQQEQNPHHPCADESLQTSTYYDNKFESQTDSSVAYQLAETYAPTVAMMSSMLPDEVVHNSPEYSQPHQSDYFAAQPDAYEESLGGFCLADHDLPLEQESIGKELVHNLHEFSQPHQSNYVAAQPDHEDAYDEMSLFSSLEDLDVKLPPLEQESEDDMYSLNMGQNFIGMLLGDNDDTNMLLLGDNDDTNMLPNSTM